MLFVYLLFPLCQYVVFVELGLGKATHGIRASADLCCHSCLRDCRGDPCVELFRDCPKRTLHDLTRLYELPGLRAMYLISSLWSSSAIASLPQEISRISAVSPCGLCDFMVVVVAWFRTVRIENRLRKSIERQRFRQSLVESCESGRVPSSGFPRGGTMGKRSPQLSGSYPAQLGFDQEYCGAFWVLLSGMRYSTSPSCAPCRWM
jgi:hypothetical protein